MDLKGGKLKIVQESTTWPTEDVRRASVNSFGYGGANAHTILEAVDFLAPGHAGVKASDLASSFGEDAAEASDRAEVSQRRHFLLPFSAHNDRTLKSNVDALQPVVDSWHLIDVAYTLSCRRSTLSTRAFVIAEQGQAQIALQPDKLTTSKSLGSQALSLGFVFTGTLLSYDLYPPLTVCRTRCTVATDGTGADGEFPNLSKICSLHG